MRFCIGIRSLSMAVCAAVMLGHAGIAQGIGERLRDIKVEGVERIDADTVRSYMGLRAGDAVVPADLDKALKAIFATGLFSDVTIRREGLDLVVRVIENPIINRIAFEGNRRISDQILNNEVRLRPRVVLTRARVQADLQRIMDIYRRSGRFSAMVEPKVIQLPQNRVDLVFEISEGTLTEIRKISFVGNERFDDGDLRKVIQTKETAWYRFLSSGDTYDPDRLTFDRELLRRHYLANGYADFRVVSAVSELTADNSAFFVTFSIEEGERYKFGEIKLTSSLKDMKTEDLKQQITVKQGDWYNADAVEDSIDKLTDETGERGYAFTDIRPRVRRDRDARMISIEFVIQEGPRAFVDLINIDGNLRTQDAVIRRELLLVENDTFNLSKLRRSRTRIRNLGFFEKVEIKSLAGSTPDKTVLNVAVKEKSTGQVSIGAGFSSTSGVLGDVSIRESNLLGRGQDLKLGLQLGDKQTNLELSFTEPYFLGRDLSAGFDIFRTVSDLQTESSFDRKSTGFALRTRYLINAPLTQSIKYTLRKNEITDVPSDASLAIKQQEGSFVTSSIGQSLLYDKRDNRFEPTRGYFVQMDNTVAGLGGDSRFLRNEVTSGYYFEVADEWVVNLSGAIGHIVGLGEDIRIADHFFIGGSSLRGFEAAGIGPRDLATDDALGGRWNYRSSLGITFPLGLPNEFGVKGKVFTDAGSLGSSGSSAEGRTDTGSLRVAVGAGLAWKSPFGPISITLSRAVLKEDFDKTELFRFNLGTIF